MSFTIFTDADDIRHCKLSELRKIPLRNGSEAEFDLAMSANWLKFCRLFLLLSRQYHGSSRFKSYNRSCFVNSAVFTADFLKRQMETDKLKRENEEDLSSSCVSEDGHRRRERKETEDLS
ncbi:unnamed protein product [Calypogeia fissa]